MLVLTRERLLTELVKIPALVDRYQRREPDFSGEVAAWLRQFEEQLTPLRHPLIGFIAGRRGLLLGIAEGATGSDVQQARGSRRKATAGCALQALVDVESAARAEIERIDQQFNEWRDKLIQLLAVASSREPLLLPNGEARLAWLQAVWRSLGEAQDTLGMYNYLNAAVAMSDRLQLLDEVLGNLLAGNGHSVAPAEASPTAATGTSAECAAAEKKPRRKPATRRRKRES